MELLRKTGMSISVVTLFGSPNVIIIPLSILSWVHTRFLTKVSVLSETSHKFSPYLLACGVL